MQINVCSPALCCSRAVADRQEYQPAARAPATGLYEELNIFGSPTGRVEHVQGGERLPQAPRGFSWRPTEEDHC